jgi:hypothetical protein
MEAASGLNDGLGDGRAPEKDMHADYVVATAMFANIGKLNTSASR